MDGHGSPPLAGADEYHWGFMNNVPLVYPEIVGIART